MSHTNNQEHQADGHGAAQEITVPPFVDANSPHDRLLSLLSLLTLLALVGFMGYWYFQVPLPP